MKLFSLALLAACGSTTLSSPGPAPKRGIVDSHVHVTLYPVDRELVAAGVLYAVDLGAPDRALQDPTSLRGLLRSGAMLTRPGGYPLNAWGVDGYGVGCATEACVSDRIAALAANRVKVVKLALDDDGLDPALVPIAVRAAHARGMKVAVHALSAASADLAARAGADVLAHTPLEPLPDDTVQRWQRGAVITTLAAFGGSPEAVANLRRLRAAGATVLYGTDLGNLRDVGPSPSEIALMKQAGMDDAAVEAAMSSVPLHYWAFDEN
jgi:hypothetical protein